MATKVSLIDLRASFEALISHLESKGISTISVESSGYWYFNITDALDLYGSPQPSLGDYEEDLDKLAAIRAGSDEDHRNGIQSLSSIIQYAGKL
jgi:hypothetical protein